VSGCHILYFLTFGSFSKMNFSGIQREGGSTAELESLKKSNDVGPIATNPEFPSSNEDAIPSEANAITAFVDSVGRAMGQVIFLNSPVSGAFLLGGLMIGGGLNLATLAVLATVVSNGTAILAGMDSASNKAGLWGYNGCLVGCAMAVFGPVHIAMTTVATFIGAIASTFVMAALKEASGVPQWTFAFNVVALSVFLYTQPLSAVDDGAKSAAVVAPLKTMDFLAIPFVGISQIFLVESAVAGVTMTVGIASYSYGLGAIASFDFFETVFTI